MEENQILKLIELVTNTQNEKICALLTKAINEYVKKNANDDYHSVDINEIAIAFAKAQGEFPSVGFNRDNTFFKSGYADLDAILRAVQPSLHKNGLSFYQFTKIGDGGEIILHSRLLHSSGQWLETRSRIVPEKGDHQSYGKAVSYHRRYAAMTLLRITASNDPLDDDAEGLMERHRDLGPASTIHKYKPQEQPASLVTKEQLEQLEYELTGHPDLAEKFMTAAKIDELCDLPRAMFQDSINKIRERKAILNKVK